MCRRTKMSHRLPRLLMSINICAAACLAVSFLPVEALADFGLGLAATFTPIGLLAGLYAAARARPGSRRECGITFLSSAPLTALTYLWFVASLPAS